ncbi:MAG TPA: c-type cytochrome [Chitinophagaceae bacterium]
MIPCNPINRKFVLIVLVSFFSLSLFAQNGQQLFSANCASCHSVTKQLVGPALANVETRGPWGDRKNIYDWVHNSDAFAAKNGYAKDLKATFGGTAMTHFPDLGPKDIDAILDYVNKATTAGPGDSGKTGGTSPEGGPEGSNKSWVIFGVISLIMGIIALILMQVNSNLKKLSDDSEGILRPEPIPFYRNKVYITFITILLFIVAGYFITKGAIGLGRQQAYEPRQPIFYSHRVHAGINQISCLYCHGNAWESRHAAIPSVNVCMNCHKTIQTYEKGPKLFDEEGNEINGTEQIHTLYKYAGFDPQTGMKWNPSMIKAPVDWIKIHNLPDHVYFNHSQHVRAGRVQCQTCHGNITEMDEVKQFAELNMGWCVNCHRETKVNFDYTDSTGNKFYSIYEKFHNDFKAGRMDSITVKDIGGVECQKCHY